MYWSIRFTIFTCIIITHQMKAKNIWHLCLLLQSPTAATICKLIRCTLPYILRSAAAAASANSFAGCSAGRGERFRVGCVLTSLGPRWPGGAARLDHVTKLN